jgi:hypothetical protein
MKKTRSRVVSQLVGVGAIATLGPFGIANQGWAGTDVGNGFGMIGIVQGQTARLNVVNIGDPNQSPCEVTLQFLDGEGNTLAERGIIIIGGKATSLDLDADELGGPDTRAGRVQIRAVTKVLGGRDTKNTDVATCGDNLLSTLEIFDNTTGQTTVILNPAVLVGFNPQPDPPGKPQSLTPGN